MKKKIELIWGLLFFFQKKKRFFVRIPKKNIILQVCDQISEVYLFLTMICVDVLFGFLMENRISSTAFQSYEWQKKAFFSEGKSNQHIQVSWLLK